MLRNWSGFFSFIDKCSLPGFDKERKISYLFLFTDDVNLDENEHEEWLNYCCYCCCHYYWTWWSEYIERLDSLFLSFYRILVKVLFKDPSWDFHIRLPQKLCWDFMLNELCVIYANSYVDREKTMKMILIRILLMVKCVALLFSSGLYSKVILITAVKN